MGTEHPLESGAHDCPFGPGFFLGQLRAFARDRCPDPGEGLPAVQIHLATGDVLELCHVVGLAPALVALAVLEDAGPPRRMRTELVPYHLVARVSIRQPAGRGHVGFDVDHAPLVLEARGHLSPEMALRRAAGDAEGEQPPTPPAEPGGR